MNCRLCQTEFQPFHSFGRMPIANGFLREEEVPNERFFELAVGACPECRMVQLLEQPPREWMFHDAYAFYSSTSRRMIEHFRQFADEVVEGRLTAQDPFVVEIGSNDGIMLQHFAKRGVRHLGIEPSRNVAEVAAGKGIQTISEFFDEALAERIRKENGPADVILAANVMCHIPDLHSVASGITTLLADDGLFIFEDPYVGDIIEKCAYDQIYDEHVYYFSTASLAQFFATHGLEIVDVEPQAVHGGSMRYTVSRKGLREPSSRVAAQQRREEDLGLHRPETYARFSRAITESRQRLRQILEQARADGKRVVGYGATSKSTTVTNYCGIGPGLVEFISDSTPIKQGKMSPGAHIPIRSPSEFAAKVPDYALLFAWNHADEILAKEKRFSEGGGRWLVYVPEVKLL